jgi:hypothetical protein
LRREKGEGKGDITDIVEGKGDITDIERLRGGGASRTCT